MNYVTPCIPSAAAPWMSSEVLWRPPSKAPKSPPGGGSPTKTRFPENPAGSWSEIRISPLRRAPSRRRGSCGGGGTSSSLANTPTSTDEQRSKNLFILKLFYCIQSIRKICSSIQKSIQFLFFLINVTTILNYCVDRQCRHSGFANILLLRYRW